MKLQACFLALFLASSLFGASEKMVMYKDPYCGCCDDWRKDMQQAGFEVATRKDNDMLAVKEKLGIKDYKYMSCHTGVIGGYVVEGHVPPMEVTRLLQEKPDALGISVPGMPLGSYGMDYDSREDNYQVLLLLKDGSSKVYRSYRGKNPQ